MDNKSLLLNLQELLKRDDVILMRSNNETTILLKSIVNIFIEHTNPQELINALTNEQITILLHLMDIGLGDYWIVINTYTAIIDERAHSHYAGTMLPELISVWQTIELKMKEAFKAYQIEKKMYPQQDPFEAEKIANLCLLDSEKSEAISLDNSNTVKQRYLRIEDPTIKDKLAQCAEEKISVLRIRMKRGASIPSEIGKITTLRVLDLVGFSVDCENFLPQEIVNLTSIPLVYRCILRNKMRAFKAYELTAEENDRINSQIQILQNWIDAGTPNIPYWQDNPITLFCDTQRFQLGQGHPILATKEIQSFLITLFPQALKLWAAEVETANRDPLLENSNRLVLYFRTSGKLFNLYIQAYYLAYCYPDDPAEGDLFQKKLLTSLYESLKKSTPELFEEAKVKLKYDRMQPLFVNGKIAGQEWSQNRSSWKKSAFKFFSAWTPNTQSDDYPVTSTKLNRAAQFASNAFS